MLIGVPTETDLAETRVAATPETVKKFVGLGAEVAIEQGAGAKAGFLDADSIWAHRIRARKNSFKSTEQHMRTAREQYSFIRCSLGKGR